MGAVLEGAPVLEPVTRVPGQYWRNGWSPAAIPKRSIEAPSAQDNGIGNIRRGLWSGRNVARVRGGKLFRLLEHLALRGDEFFNVSRAARDLGLRRETVERYFRTLKRLYLARRLPAWRRDPTIRPISSPKVYLLDSGLEAALAGLKAED